MVALLDQGTGGETASILRVIFEPARLNPEILASWLASAEKDQAIQDKEATGELLKLIEHRLDLKVDPDIPLASIRIRTARHVLIGEFRDDLATEPPAELQIVPRPETAEQLALVREVARTLRVHHAERYMALADEIEKEFQLASQSIAPEHLGRVDTFRFEERVLLSHAHSLITLGRYAEAHALIADRERGFWAHRSVERQLQWAVCLTMAELGQIVKDARIPMAKLGNDPSAWVAAYTAEDGWHHADSAHISFRDLESLMGRIDEEPESEPALQRVRLAHEEMLQKMAVGFGQALQGAGWTVPKTLPQTRIYPELVEKAGARVAYFLVDALRFEMGVELKNLLTGGEDLVLRPAIAALPTITPVGMAALLPGASARFDVVEADGALASRIENVTLKDTAGRMKFLKLQVPGAVDLELGKLLQMSSTRLKNALGNARLIVVRSQEIDKFGEMDGDSVARQMMDTVLQNIARAVRRLAGAGIDFVVITADHGYQFTREKEEAFRTDSPGGSGTVDLHRRCWVGRGGANPPGTVRVAGAELGYDTDMDFVFPTGIGVFRGSRAICASHHGGPACRKWSSRCSPCGRRSRRRPGAHKVSGT